MAEAIEGTGERRSPAADRHESAVAVPGGGGADVEITAKDVAARQTHALQVVAGGAAGRAQAVDHCVDLGHAIVAQPGAEILARRQVHLGLDVVGAGIARGRIGLAVFERQAGGPGAAQRAVDIDVVVRRERELVGIPHDVVVDVDVAGARTGGHGLDRDVAGLERIGVERAGLVATGGGNREVGRIDQPGAGQAPGRCRGHAQVIGKLDVRGRRLDETAVAAATGWRAGVQCAGRVHGAALHVAQQLDGAATRVDAVGFDHAGVVDHGLEQVAGRLRREYHSAAVGLHQAAVLHQCTHCALIHRHVEQPVAGHVKRDGLARRQRHRAQPRIDRAFVRNVSAQQGHIAARGGEVALIQHLATAVAGKLVTAGHEIGIGNIERGRHQACRVDRRTLAEQDAVRVDDEHFTVGRHIAEDGRCITAEHAVQGDRVAVRLDKLHRFALADIERAPVDDGVLAGLVDHGGAGRAVDLGLARDDGAAGGPGQRQVAVAEHQRRRHAGQREVRATAAGTGHGPLAGGFDVLGDGGVGTGGLVPDGVVDVIHGGS